MKDLEKRLGCTKSSIMLQCQQLSCLQLYVYWTITHSLTCMSPCLYESDYFPPHYFSHPHRLFPFFFLYWLFSLFKHLLSFPSMTTMFPLWSSLSFQSLSDWQKNKIFIFIWLTSNLPTLLTTSSSSWPVSAATVLYMGKWPKLL